VTGGERTEPREIISKPRILSIASSNMTDFMGLASVIRTVPTYGSVGTSVFLLGNNLTGTTKVTFDGVSSSFTVVSSTEITTTVPSGASTGEVSVTTPSGKLSSNVNFYVP
jgi:uncharacterized protein (TIGR03437 family)